MITSVLIADKRDGKEHLPEEIDFLIQGYARGEIPDYQMSAWAMAVYLQGMTPAEIECLTDSMIASGKVLQRCSDRPRVDKHSTGGLGDKTSLILAPLLALYDLDVPMISGRGLGITGGTLDKLEAIPGFRTDLDEREIADCLQRCGCVITGASQNLVPADRKLYALRDVTATVPSIPLITASIMSKKLAESLDALVLDVKWGSGAFRQTKATATTLAASLVRIGQRMKVQTTAILSDMNQPLGRMVGNACEVNESIDIMQGGGPSDVRQLTLELAASLLVHTGRCTNLGDARAELAKTLDSGQVWLRFQQMVECQGGRIIEHQKLASQFVITADRAGFIESMDGQKLGQAVIELGGGRKVVGQPVDHRVGLEMHARVGDPVTRGMPLLTIYASDQSSYERAERLVVEAMSFSDRPPALPRLMESL